MEQDRGLLSALENIGLTEKQAAVYLALLSLQSSTAYQIAQHCDVKKPTVYVILEELRQKGLVLKVPHAKKALFAARDITEYLQEQKDKLRAVESIVPRLHSLGGSPRPNVYLFNGLRGIAESFDYKLASMRDKTFHSFYGNLTGFDEELLRVYSKWDQKAFGQNTSFKVVAPKKGRNYIDIIELPGRKEAEFAVKYLQEYAYPENISIEIADDFVRTTNAKTLQSTILDDKATADAMRQIFNIVWEKGV